MRIHILTVIILLSSVLNSQEYYSDRVFVKLNAEYKNTFALETDVRLRLLLNSSEILTSKTVSTHPLLSST